MGGFNAVPLKYDKFRHLETISFSDTPGPSRTKLPVTDVYRQLALYLSGTVTVDAGGADGVLTAESILSLMRNIKVEGTSRVRTKLSDIKNADAAALYQIAHFLRGTPPLYSDPTPITKGSALSPFSFMLPIEFSMPFSQDPRQSLLRTAQEEVASLNLLIDWGNSADVFSAGTITAFTGTLRISAAEFVDEFIKGQKYSLHTIGYIEEDTIATNTKKQIRLKRGNVLRGVMLKQFTRSGVYYHTPHEAAVTEVALHVNRVEKKSFTWKELQAQNKIDYGMVTVPTGYAFLDLMPEARYDTVVDTSRYDDIDIFLNVTGTANSYVRAYPVELIPE